MFILKVDGTKQELTDTSLKGMQEAVGGYIEVIPTKNGQFMIFNEEGKWDNLPRNEKANEMVNLFAGDYIVGDVIIAEAGEIE